MSREARFRRIAVVVVCAVVAAALVIASLYISDSWKREVASVGASGNKAVKEKSQLQSAKDSGSGPESAGVVAAVGESASAAAVSVVGEAIPSAAAPAPEVANPAATPSPDVASLSGSLVAVSSEVATTASALMSAQPVQEAESLSLDARELLFGKKGRNMGLIASVEPVGADMSDIEYSSSDRSVATVNSEGVVRSKGWGTCRITAKLGELKAVCKVTVASKWVALTFDDGPGLYTDKLLTEMKKRSVRCTFFVVGQMAKPRADILKKADRYGNEIGNHTYAHNGSAGVLMDALRTTDDVVENAIGKRTALMRPPGGAINDVTWRCGKPIIMWTVDPKDWRDRNADTVYSRVMENTRSGSIILLHDIHPTSVAAAYRIMDELKARGYAFVTVSEMLKNPMASKSYNSGPKKVRTMKIKY
ncbi:MAG: polysaccharide deacetylase family protein [Clostridiales Family XIII bacterium]|nr:polysaccharide deacetylase family protein [Clostridiales Family XIII bacterium]